MVANVPLPHVRLTPTPLLTFVPGAVCLHHGDSGERGSGKDYERGG